MRRHELGDGIGSAGEIELEENVSVGVAITGRVEHGRSARGDRRQRKSPVHDPTVRSARRTCLGRGPRTPSRLAMTEVTGACLRRRPRTIDAYVREPGVRYARAPVEGPSRSMVLEARKTMKPLPGCRASRVSARGQERLEPCDIEASARVELLFSVRRRQRARRDRRQTRTRDWPIDGPAGTVGRRSGDERAHASSRSSAGLCPTGTGGAILEGFAAPNVAAPLTLRPRMWPTSGP